MLKVEIFKPQVLTFGHGDAAFSIKLKNYTVKDRMAIIDSLMNPSGGRVSMAEITETTMRVVCGWDGVFNAAGEMPLAFDAVDSKSGQPLHYFSKMLAALPLRLCIEVVTAIMASVGVPAKPLNAVRDTFADWCDEPPMDQVDPMSPPAVSTSATV